MNRAKSFGAHTTPRNGAIGSIHCFKWSCSNWDNLRYSILSLSMSEYWKNGPYMTPKSFLGLNLAESFSILDHFKEFGLKMMLRPSSVVWQNYILHDYINYISRVHNVKLWTRWSSSYIDVDISPIRLNTVYIYTKYMVQISLYQWSC